MPRKHAVIPDCQVEPGVDISHMDWIGDYLIDKQPDVIVCIGDFFDMASLSLYDRGKASFEGKRYKKDVEYGIEAMTRLLAPMKAYNERRAKNKEKQYRPEMHFTLGNHEQRILRAVDDDAKLEGVIGLEDLKLEEFGWKVHPFLEVAIVDGVAYSHYFTTGVLGRPVGNAKALVKAKHMSATMGHVQTTDIHLGEVRADGKPVIGLMCGTCYLHRPGFLGAQGQDQRRQIVMKHEVEDGCYDPMFVSLKYLKSRYEAKYQSTKAA
jgi:hypothetical protein